MSITAELREWIQVIWDLPKTQSTLLSIADRIDAEHELAIAYVDDRDPVTMDEHGWIRLPLDMDDAFVHAGDKMVFIGLDGSVSKPFVVEGFESAEMWLVYYREGHRYVVNPTHTRHYHLTVDDVLTDMLDEWGELPSDQPADEIIVKYAAKLQLKEDE